MISLRSALAVSGLAVAVLAVVVTTRCGGAYATFRDSATGSQQVTAAGNFVPTQCQGLAGNISSYNVIRGTSGNDNLVGSDNSGVKDLIFGLGGDDVIDGRNGSDCIVGGDGNDTLRGSNGGDILIGGNGDDGLNGGNGNDTCDGGDGADTAVNCETVTNVP